MCVRLFRYCIVFLAAVLFCSYSISAQIKPLFEHTYYIDSASGKKYWNKSVSFQLKLVSNDEQMELLLDNKQVEEVYFDTEGLNTLKSPWLIDPVTKQYVNPKTEITFNVYVDGYSPSTLSKYENAPLYKAGKVTYFGKNLEIVLTAYDKVSGVKKIYYSLDGKDYGYYTKPLSVNSEGKHLFKYFSVDHVGNDENVGEKSFVVYTSAPKTYHSITDLNVEKNVLALSTKLSLIREDNLSGVKTTFYSIDDGAERIYKGGNLYIANLKNGDHKLEYYSVDNVQNKENVNVYTFYLDKVAPILSSDILGDRYIVNDQIYFSGRTKMKLTAIDNKSGVKDILYSINGGEYMSYADPFYLPSKEGLHIIKFYATDNVSNSTGAPAGGGAPEDEYKHAVVKRIFTDLVGPSLKYRYNGVNFSTRDTVFVSTSTKISLSAKDNASGLQYIAYSIDGQKEETVYESPFSLKGGGLHKIEVFGYDNVNNRNKNVFYCFLDTVPPVVHITFSIPSKGEHDIDGKQLKSYPYFVTLFLAASDNTVGADRIYYQLNGGKEVLYTAPLSGFSKNAVNVLNIRVLDKLNNEQIEQIMFYTQ